MAMSGTTLRTTATSACLPSNASAIKERIDCKFVDDVCRGRASVAPRPAQSSLLPATGPATLAVQAICCGGSAISETHRSLVRTVFVDTHVDLLMTKIKSLEDELEAELAIRRTKLKYTLQGSRALFEQEILQAHRALRKGLARYFVEAGILHIVTAPVTYALIVPLVLLDVFVTIYQRVCFPVYGIEKVRRGDYLIFDRYQLQYLNIIEKINCAYCSYANGLLAYVREIAGRTERYFCPIKHARRVIAAHQRYNEFAEFGDAEAFRKRRDGA
jgi:hypothetical protein